MAIKFKNYTGVCTSALSTSRSGTIPTGFSEGDLLIAVASAHARFDYFSMSNPSGWTGIQNAYASHDDDTGGRMLVSYRIAQAGDTSWSWTTNIEVYTFCVYILRYTGQSLISPIHTSASQAWVGDGSKSPSVNYTDLNKGSMVLYTIANSHEISTPSFTTRYIGSERAAGDKEISGSGSTGTGDWQSSWAASVVATVSVNAKKSFIPTINIF